MAIDSGTISNSGVELAALVSSAVCSPGGTTTASSGVETSALVSSAVCSPGGTTTASSGVCVAPKLTSGTACFSSRGGVNVGSRSSDPLCSSAGTAIVSFGICVTIGAIGLACITCHNASRNCSTVANLSFLLRDNAQWTALATSV